MKASDDLFRLIKSMTKSEKRYCRLFLAQGMGREATGSLALFDAIGRQSQYDEAKLRNELAEHRFASHLAVAKSDLYALLLKGLRAYHDGTNHRKRVSDMIDAAVILMKKGLSDQARKLLRKAKTVALENDLQPEILRILYWEWEIDAGLSYADVTPADLESRLREVDSAIDTTRNLWQFIHGYAMLGQHICTHGAPRNGEERSAIDSILNDPVIGSGENAATTTAYKIFCTMQIVGAFMTGDYERGYTHSRMLIDIYERSDGKRGALIQPSALYQHMSLCIRLEKLKEAYQTYLRLEELKNSPSTPTSAIELFYSAATEIHGALRDFRTIIDLAPEITRFCERYKDDVATQLHVVFPVNLAHAYFAEGELPKAAALLHEIIGGESSMRSDVQTAARLLQLMTHYEMENTTLLPYLWRSTYRYLSKRSGLNHLERLLLDFMRKLPAITSRTKLIASFRALRGEIQVILESEDAYDLERVKNLDLIPWLDAKIKGKRITDIISQIRKEYARELA